MRPVLYIWCGLKMSAEFAVVTQKISKSVKILYLELKFKWQNHKYYITK